MKRLQFLALVLGFLLSGSLRADTIRTLALNAQLSSKATYAQTDVLTGTFTFNADTGAVLSVDFDFVGRLPATFRNTPPYVDHFYGLTFLGTDFGGYNGITPYSINIVLPVADLIGYTGGNVCSAYQTCFVNNDVGALISDLGLPLGRSDYVQQGSISAAPEPSSLVLMATGLSGIFGLALMKSRAE